MKDANFQALVYALVYVLGMVIWGIFIPWIVILILQGKIVW